MFVGGKEAILKNILVCSFFNILHMSLCIYTYIYNMQRNKQLYSVLINQSISSHSKLDETAVIALIGN